MGLKLVFASLARLHGEAYASELRGPASWPVCIGQPMHSSWSLVDSFFVALYAYVRVRREEEPSTAFAKVLQQPLQTFCKKAKDAGASRASQD